MCSRAAEGVLDEGASRAWAALAEVGAAAAQTHGADPTAPPGACATAATSYLSLGRVTLGDWVQVYFGLKNPPSAAEARSRGQRGGRRALPVLGGAAVLGRVRLRIQHKWSA